jgi:hypothetical protein
MDIIPDSSYNLRRLQHWLEYEISASGLLLFSWFWGLLLGLAALAAIIFTPFMLKILYEEGKYGWIIFFFVMVIAPSIIIFFLDIGITGMMLLSYISMGLFFLYCFALKFAVRGWINDYKLQRGQFTSEEERFNNYKI